MRRASIPIFSLCLFLTLAFTALTDPAAAQQPQEKRVALVVGDGAYAKSPLATAANDAGLIAQTLQAAGFDVIGARDLDAETLRKSFRDFMQKVQAAPADTVAVIYLSGYGVQLSGENYFIPVDSTINTTTDIPIEALRISDYMRELASVPLKASVLILDAAREQPFIEGPQPLAGGLALVDPPPNMLIAFNAAPGTVAASESGDYGIYAQSLAEMIRTGGLSLPDLFDRLRLRVSEASKGAQIPWDVQKIQAQFTFFDRAPDAPPLQGPPDQVAAIRDKPLRDLSAQDAYAAAVTRDTMQGYQDFLGAYPGDPMARRVRAILAARREAITWRRSYLADTPDAYWSYLRRYPDGPHAWDARRRLAILNAVLEPPPSFAMLDYDVPPPPPDEVVFVDRPVFYFGDPVFGFAPPPPPPIYFLPPPPPDFVVLPPPFAPVGLFILPQPVFVPMPVFCRPPVYVVPPPNNIIFNNIHNTTVINTVINRPPPQLAAGNPVAAVAAAASLKPVGATTPVPNFVHQQAMSIQKDPTRNLRPSQQAFVSNPAAKVGASVATPVHASPGALPERRQGLPKANALPVPGAKGAPSAPQGALASPAGSPNPNAREPAAKGALNPNAKFTPTTPPKTTPPNVATPAEVAKPNLREEKRGGPAAPGKPPVAQTQPTTPGGHENRITTTPPRVPAKPELKPAVRSEAKPAKMAAPPPPKPEVRHAASPPPQPLRPASPPPSPRPEVRRAASPPPPPPRPASPPPPPRAQPRPQAVARPAPPPAAPRPPPPARPALAAKPAPAKRCPPNAPKC